MSTSGSYNFAPSLGELVLYAFNMAGVRPSAILQEHMESARIASNLILGRWSAAQGVNLWQVDLQTVPLIAGQATYAVPTNTIAMLDAYITQAGTNRTITPISRSEYATYSNPTQQGSPTVFWFDRLLAPAVTLYQTPDGQATSLSYYRVRQAQDANFTSGQNVEIPVYYLEAYADALAYRMAKIWNPEAAGLLKADAEESYGIASDQNIERSAIYVTPSLSSYWRS